jgi:filamentous hemagglutinin family protein
MLKRLVKTILILPCLSIWFSVPIAFAQVIPDNSLGKESSTVTNGAEVKQQLVDLISGGATRDNNLFHSFTEFSIPEAAKVYFANPEGITNILTRITGKDASEILGTLGVNGNANLFLLNPNGIIFGQNSRLDVSGSFLATTADRLIFNNGFAFSASNPESPPLLTVNIPVGLQFGTKAEPIVNRSQSLDFNNLPVGLQMKPKQNLSFVGGDIVMESGKISAPFARVELVSVTPDSFVGIQPDASNWKLNFDRVSNFQDITLSQNSQIDTSGSGGGEVFVKGKRVTFSDGSDIFSLTLGDDNGGGINIDASESIDLIGGQVEGQYFAFLDTSTIGKGNGGKINITTSNLRLLNGGRIIAGTIAEGNAGDISIAADRVEAVGTTSNGTRASTISNATEDNATGNGGNLWIDTKNLLIRDGVQIAVSTSGTGMAGNLNISASESIDIAGTISRANPEGTIEIFSSGLFAGVEPGAKGKGGNLSIATGNLRLSDGARVTTSTFGEGNAGDLTVTAKNVEVDGVLVDEIGSFNGLLANVEKDATGKGGNLTINTDRLRILNGGQVSASTFGNGDAGNVTVTAKDIELSGTSPDRKFSSSLSAASTTPFNAGFLNVNTDTLNVSNDAQISVSSIDRLGGAGNLELKANSIFLDKGGSLRAEVNTGDRGNIKIESSYFQLGRDSKVTTDAFGRASGGNITIKSDNLVLLENSSIVADSLNDFGGLVTVHTKGLFQSLDSQITASSDRGAFFNGIVEINKLEVDPQSLMVNLPQETVEPKQTIVRSCSAAQDYSLVVSGRGGIPQNPSQTIRSDTVWSDLRLLSDDRVAEKKVDSPSTINKNYPPIEARQLKINQKGNLELVANSDRTKDRRDWQKTLNCSELKSNEGSSSVRK